MVNVKDGDWFVEVDWRYRVRKAIRVTKQMVFYMPENGTRKSRARLDKVTFSTTNEALARRVADQLASSDALCDQEKRDAVNRRVKRNAKIILDASSAQAA